MRKIAIMTGTRADYGLLRPLIAAVDASPEAELQLIVTGTHLSAQHGKTIDEIVRDGFTPAAEVDIWGAEPTKDLLGEEGTASLTAAVETGEAVAALAQRLHAKVNLIEYNATDDDLFQGTSREKSELFQRFFTLIHTNVIDQISHHAIVE